MHRYVGHLLPVSPTEHQVFGPGPGEWWILQNLSDGTPHPAELPPKRSLAPPLRAQAEAESWRLLAIMKDPEGTDPAQD